MGQPVGARLALMLQKMKLGENVTAEGPRIKELRVIKEKHGIFKVRASFDRNGLFLKGTRNCTTCCSGNVSDFDFSVDGETWYDGTAAEVSHTGEKNVVQVNVNIKDAPRFARYTANR